MSIRWFMRRLALGVVGLATFSSLALVGTTPAQAADPPVAVMVTGEAQVYIVDTPGDDTAPASTSATAQITLLGGATVWVADGSGLRTGDTVSLGVVVPTDLVAALSDADKITLAAAPVIDGVRQVDGTTDLGQALLTATLAATASPEVTALTVVASPSRAPLSPPETAQTTTPAVTAATLTHTVDLVVATAPGASTTWLSEAQARQYIADVQAWYRENTGQAFVFTVNAVKTLTSANVCGETGNTTASWTQAAALFGRSSYSAYESGGNGTHLIVLENLTYCPNASYVGLGSTSRSPGYAQGGEVTVRVDKSDWRRGVVDLSHELGHNFGLNHSNEWLCSSRSGTSNWNQADSNGSCAALEYADLFEFMGYGIEPGAMDAVRKYQTGLLQTSAVKVIDTAATATPVTLKPVPTTDNTSVELAYVKDSVPPGSTADSTFSGLPYLVEYRHITDPWYGGERWGVEVLRADASETWLLQPTTTWPLYYVSDEVLDVGDTFTSIGGLISVTVTAMNSSSATVTITRQESATSIATVAITGTAQVGNTVTASATGVTPAGAALAYQWLRNGTAIAGATASTYALAAADANTSLAAKVTATATGYSASAATSAAVLVASGTLTPATPTITGTTRSADTLTANPGTWTPAGVTFAYQWLRDGTTIAGATAKTYTLQAADVGKKLTVAVTGTLAGYTPRTMTSAATAVVAPGCTTGTPVKPMTRFTLGVDMTSDSRGETLAVDKQGTLWAYQGTATGALGAACQLGSGFAPAQVFGPGDLDGDGKADVLAITANGDLWLYPGDGPSLKTAIQVGSGWTGWRLVPTGDLTGDGKADLLGINAKGALFLYSGKGDGHFQTRVQVGSGWTGWDLYAAGDLNADKKADILGINASGALFQYTGKGTGLFNPRVQAGSGWTGWQLAAGADLTGDGQADIIGRNNKTGDLNFYKGLGNAKFATKVLVDTGW